MALFLFQKWALLQTSNLYWMKHKNILQSQTEMICPSLTIMLPLEIGFISQTIEKALSTLFHPHFTLFMPSLPLAHIWEMNKSWLYSVKYNCLHLIWAYSAIWPPQDKTPRESIAGSWHHSRRNECAFMMKTCSNWIMRLGERAFLASNPSSYN